MNVNTILFLCASQDRLLLYKKQIGTHREKKAMAGRSFGPKSGPQNGAQANLKEGMKMWSNSGLYFGPKEGQPSENFAAARRCFCKQICEAPGRKYWHAFSLCASQFVFVQSRSLHGGYVSTRFLDPVFGAKQASRQTLKSLAAECLVSVRLGC